MKDKNPTALIFWTKTRLGWSEKNKLEIEARASENPVHVDRQKKYLSMNGKSIGREKLSNI